MGTNVHHHHHQVVVAPKVVTFVSSLIQRLVDSNDENLPLIQSRSNITAFHNITWPTISISNYLDRIFKYSNCDPSTFVMAYIYLNRFMRKNPSLPINSFNSHRLLITSVLVASKFMDRSTYNNTMYAMIGGLSGTKEMNLLESKFLFGVSFDLNVKEETFHNYCSHIQIEMVLESPLSTLCLKTSLKFFSCFPEDQDQVHQKQRLSS